MPVSFGKVSILYHRMGLFVHYKEVYLGRV